MDIAAEIDKYLQSKQIPTAEPKIEPIDYDLNNEINSILHAAISTDISKLEERHEGPKTEATTVLRCSVCCSQKPRYKCPACFMRVRTIYL